VGGHLGRSAHSPFFAFAFALAFAFAFALTFAFAFAFPLAFAAGIGIVKLRLGPGCVRRVRAIRVVAAVSAPCAAGRQVERRVGAPPSAHVLAASDLATGQRRGASRRLPLRASSNLARIVSDDP
jgi:hypothetical protein